MPEHTVPLVITRTHYICDVCGRGRMFPTGRTLPEKAHFEHRCGICDATLFLDQLYPFMVPEEVQ